MKAFFLIFTFVCAAFLPNAWSQEANWVKIGDKASNVYAGGQNLFATNPVTGDIYKWEGDLKWIKIGGPGKMFAVDSEGRLYGITPDGQAVWQYDNVPMKWHFIGDAANEIYAGGNRIIATNPQNGNLYLYNSTKSTWALIGEGGSKIVMDHEGGIYRLAKDRKSVWKYERGEKWKKIGADAAEIYAGANKIVATAPGNGDVMLYEGSKGWANIGGPGKYFYISPQGNIYGIDAQNYLWEYSGKPNEWRRIWTEPVAYVCNNIFRNLVVVHFNTRELWWNKPTITN